MVFVVSSLIDTTVPLGNCSDGDVRLVGGTVANEGRVEVCTNQVWASVCYSTYGNYGGSLRNSNWDAIEAKVVCRQLGYLEQGKYCGVVWGVKLQCTACDLHFPIRSSSPKA